MQYGHFDDERMEYVIDQPDTPRPWSNYIGTTRYGGIITNHAGGYSFYQTAKEGRFVRFRPNAVPLDEPGRYFYIRDNETGQFWSAAWQPVGADLSEYSSTCRHGTGYTVINSAYRGIESESTYFVPLGKEFECWMLKLANKSNVPRKLSVFTYCEFASQWNTDQDLINLQYSQFIAASRRVENIIGVSIHDKLDYNAGDILKGGRQDAFMAISGAPIIGFDTDREEAIGVYRGYHAPRFAVEGRCRNSLAYSGNTCGTFHVELNLQPGESKEILVLLGVGRAEVEGKAALSDIATPARAAEELEKVKDHWHGMLGNFRAETPDPLFNSSINVWTAYNCLMTFNWSRSASFIYQGERNGLGFRDSVQDIVGTACNIPELSRERLELMLTGQCSSGGALHVVKPFEHTPGKMRAPEAYRSDDCLWFFNAVPEYVKETGDMGFYDKVLPYADAGEATVLEHLRRALEFSFEHTGKNGVPAGLLADWNDCLNLGDEGETFFVAMQVVYGLKEYIDICTRLHKLAEKQWAQARLEEMEGRIRKIGWDGAWFIRAIRGNGSVIGTHADPEASIFLNTQSWAVISGVADRRQAEIAMDSVNEKLFTEYGCMVCAPPFKTKPRDEISAMVFLDGLKENAGVFLHPQGWAVMAEAMLGHGDRAYRYFTASMPARMNDKADIREIEPYVYCQHTLSRYSRREGVSRVPWLTGAAAWAYFAATHYILGIRPEYDGLTVDPCIPRHWKGFRVRRRFRSMRLLITVENPSGVEKGIVSLAINGRKIDGAKIPADMIEDGSEVLAVMGRR